VDSFATFIEAPAKSIEERCKLRQRIKAIEAATSACKAKLAEEAGALVKFSRDDLAAGLTEVRVLDSDIIGGDVEVQALRVAIERIDAKLGKIKVFAAKLSRGRLCTELGEEREELARRLEARTRDLVKSVNNGISLLLEHAEAGDAAAVAELAAIAVKNEANFPEGTGETLLNIIGIALAAGARQVASKTLGWRRQFPHCGKKPV